MNIVLNQSTEITEILDSDEKVLIKYPIGTLLDKITDVWSLIIDYYHHFRPFAFGMHSDKYTHYRLITHEECNTKKFIQLFKAYYGKSYYKKEYGIRSLVSDGTAQKYLCSDIGSLTINNNVLYLNYYYILRDWHYSIVHINMISDIEKIKTINKICGEPYGLFVLSHLNFHDD